MRSSLQDDQFRRNIREGLAANLTGRFAALRDAGGPTLAQRVIIFYEEYASYLTGEVISVSSQHL